MTQALKLRRRLLFCWVSLCLVWSKVRAWSNVGRSHSRAISQLWSTAASAEPAVESFMLPSFQTQLDNYLSPLHRIHCVPVMTPLQARACCELAQSHAERSGSWDRPDTERHRSYSTCDFAVEDCLALDTYLHNIGLHAKIFDELSTLYRVDEALLSYLDLFCVRYSPPTAAEPRAMDRLELHRDGSLLSYSVTLSCPANDFVEGGTTFDALRDVETQGSLGKSGIVRPTAPGVAVLHSGKILHGAAPVVQGERIVLVGFVSVDDLCQRPHVLAEACKVWGRMDEAFKREQRQQRRRRQDENVWWPHSRLHPSGNSILPFCMLSSNVSRLADPEYQRRVRLQAEDVLLRTILVDPTESSWAAQDLFDQDVTIL